MSVEIPLTIMIWSASLITLTAAAFLLAAGIYFLVVIWRD